MLFRVWLLNKVILCFCKVVVLAITMTEPYTGDRVALTKDAKMLIICKLMTR